MLNARVFRGHLFLFLILISRKIMVFLHRFKITKLNTWQRLHY